MLWAFLGLVQVGGAALGWVCIEEGARRSALYVLGAALLLTGMMFGPRLGEARHSNRRMVE